MNQRNHRERNGRQDWLDAESAQLLDDFTAYRLAATRRPTSKSVHSERRHLRSLLRSSRALGGPQTLRSLVGDPGIIARVLRGDPPRSHLTLLGMHLAVTRFIGMMAAPEQGQVIRDRIAEGLFPRPMAGVPPQFSTRTVGGYNKVTRSRPVLALADIERIIEAAGGVFPDKSFAERNRALIATLAFSGLSLPEIVCLRQRQVELREATVDRPWCAFVHGVARGHRSVSVAIHVKAKFFLDALLPADSTKRAGASGPLFRSRRHGNTPLSYGHGYRIVRAALRGAGLCGGDSTTFRQAYAAFLRQSGLNEYLIRDALGVLRMITVDRLLQPQAGRAAQAVAAEHHVIEPPDVRRGANVGLQAALPLAGFIDSPEALPRILGVDAAYRRTGWAVLDCDAHNPVLAAYGVIMADGSKTGQSLLNIEREFREVLAKWRPDEVLLETPGKWVHRRGSSRKSIELLAMARGAMLRACAEAGIPADEVDFGRVRLGLLGRANASKTDVAGFIASLGLELPTDRSGAADVDIADAVALALYGVERHASSAAVRS